MELRLAGLATGVLAVVVGAAQPVLDADLSTDVVVQAAGRYVAEYQKNLTFVIADEVYIQQIVAQRPFDPEMPRTRRLRSEVFFMFVPGDHDWMAIRDVLALDGNKVAVRPDIRDALRALPARDVAATFKDSNSRYNIGRMKRNFNEPTLSLLVLDDHHRTRFAFEKKRVERRGDMTVVTLAFSETRSPSLIHDPTRGSLLSRGEFIVEAGTGRVHRAVLAAAIDEGRLEFTTIYSADRRLGIWVPTSFREHYEHGTSSKPVESPAEHEEILGEARYTNFRRFATSARMK